MKKFIDLIEENKKSIKEISISELLQKENYTLIDIREKEEVEEGFIENSIHISRSFLEQKIEEFYPDRNSFLVLYCASGNRSVLACKSLIEMGYKNSYSLSEGINGWKNKGYKIIKPQKDDLTKNELLRYNRQIILPEVGKKGQKKLLKAKVLIIGAGGLGSPVCYYLAGAGVGTLGIIDKDIVDLSNLHRQIIHTTSRVGFYKTESAKENIKQLNPDINVITYNEEITEKNAREIIKNYDLVIDGSDNFKTKYLINDICFELNKPNVYASISKFDGYLSVFDSNDNTPCYRCFFPEAPNTKIQNCSEAGVLGVMAGTMGILQATEAIKVILGIGEIVKNKVLVYNSLDTSFREIKLKKNKNCLLCGDKKAI
ncbi:MAG: molybdopterin-synthase adenylyltransferase MoeB [Candidatus Sericytochromatia bacterium]